MVALGGCQMQQLAPAINKQLIVLSALIDGMGYGMRQIEIYCNVIGT
jgi:hypothetical protein